MLLLHLLGLSGFQAYWLMEVIVRNDTLDLLSIGRPLSTRDGGSLRTLVENVY